MEKVISKKEVGDLKVTLEETEKQFIIKLFLKMKNEQYTLTMKRYGKENEDAYQNAISYYNELLEKIEDGIAIAL